MPKGQIGYCVAWQTSERVTSLKAKCFKHCNIQPHETTDICASPDGNAENFAVQALANTPLEGMSPEEIAKLKAESGALHQDVTTTLAPQKLPIHNRPKHTNRLLEIGYPQTMTGSPLRFSSIHL